MIIRSFNDAFDLVIGSEGKYTNNPKDPGNWTGGKVGVGTCDGTMYGISAPVARRQGYTGPMQDLPLDLAKSIAKREYWDAMQCDQFDPEIGYQVLDAAYNGGHAAKWLQQAAGTTVDGVIGAGTVAAVRASDRRAVIMRFDSYALRYLTDLSIWDDFSRGWARRIAARLLEGAD